MCWFGESCCQRVSCSGSRRNLIMQGAFLHSGYQQPTMSKFQSVSQALRYWSDHDDERPAFVFRSAHGGRYVLTCARLYALGARWAAVLHQHDMGKKHVIANTLPNSPERAVCEAGILLCGATSVNGMCQLADGSDLLHVLEKSGASAIMVDPDLAWGPWTVLQQHIQLGDGNIVTSDTLPDLRRVYFIRRRNPLKDTGLTNVPQKGPGKIPDNEQGKPAGEKTSDKGNEEDNDRLENRPAIKDMTSQCTDSDSAVDTNSEDFLAALERAEDWYTTESDGEDFATIHTTSGSTGFSKLVTYTHRALVAAATVLTKEEDYEKCQLFFSISSFGWPGGYVFQQLFSGNCRVVLDDRAEPPDNLAALVWEAIVSEKCWAANLQPIILKHIVRLKDRAPYKLSFISLTGQPIKSDVVLMCSELCDITLVLYGSTETSVVTLQVVRDFDKYQDYQVGMPLPGAQLKVCDENGKEVSPGTKGEIYIKVGFMFSSYYNSPKETAAALTEDGFCRIGDIGMMLEDGSFIIEGRSNDVIHKGQYLFYPAWVESRIQRCPGLLEVLVVGVPDPDLTEEICACFVAFDPALTEEDVKQFVEQDILTSDTNEQSPKPRYYLKFESFPTTFTGKSHRLKVQEEAARRILA